MISPSQIDWNAGFFQPTDLRTALQIRARYRGKVTPIAGATLVARSINAGDFNDGRILDLSRIRSLAKMKVTKENIEIGACVTFETLEKSPLCALAEAAKGVGGPAIRRRATLGGNLVSARKDGDGCVAALAFSSFVELSTISGSRLISIDDFFGPQEGRTALRNDELLTKIIVPNGAISAWCEVGVRLGASHSIVCCAGSLVGGKIVRIAFGGAGKTVARTRAAEDIVEKGGLTDRSISAATKSVRNEVKPITDWHASAGYRREMAAVMAKRVLLSLRQTRDKRPKL